MRVVRPRAFQSPELLSPTDEAPSHAQEWRDRQPRPAAGEFMTSGVRKFLRLPGALTARTRRQRPSAAAHADKFPFSNAPTIALNIESLIDFAPHERSASTHLSGKSYGCSRFEICSHGSRRSPKSRS